MRQIKFRAWHTKLNKMFSAEELGQDELTLNPDGRGFVNVSSEDKSCSRYYTDMIPLQFTGMYDKNGTEIYEGDIITLINNSRNLEVVYSKDVACFEAIHLVGARALCGHVNSQYGVIVIGTKYENPLLLEV